MQNDFDNWGDSGVNAGKKQDDFRMAPGRGGWHWLQTLTALVITGLFSMLCAYLTRNVEERPVWMMGLIFMMPTAAMMTATMIVEKAVSAMTPSTSRRPQLILAVTATVLTFVVACLCDLIYLYGFKKPLPPAGVRTAAFEVSDRMVLITDRTASMQENGNDARSAEIISMLLDRSAADQETGMISAGDGIDPAPLTEEQKNSLKEMAGRPADQGRLYYGEAVSRALEMLEKGEREIPGRIVVLTDGKHTWSLNEAEDLTERCLRDNVRVYAVRLGETMDPVLSALAAATGGSEVSGEEAEKVLEGARTLRYLSEVTPAPVEEKLKLDLLRNREPAAILISCIMLVLEGLSLGVCLSLMLSVRGQFRLQYVLSPLMGLLAFALLKYIWNNDDIATTWWIKEGIAFSLLGIVLMKRNRRRAGAPAGPEEAQAAPDPFYDGGNDF